MRTNETTIPIEARIPKSFSAGIGLTTFVRKPIAVVTVASARATPTVPMAFLMPPDTSSPSPTSSRYREVR